MTKVITIDGPAASGKTSVSREVARALGWKWVSTGAFYRGLGFIAFSKDVDTSNESALVDLLKQEEWGVELDPEKTLVMWKGEDISKEIQQENIGNYASQVSRHPQVRAELLQAQRDLASENNGLVAEGRDCGSVVFPSAPVKIYITANQKSRAQRRATEHGSEVGKLLQQQIKRDEQDATRKVAPMQVPEGADVVDSSDLDLDQTVAKVLEIIRQKLDL